MAPDSKSRFYGGFDTNFADSIELKDEVVNSSDESDEENDVKKVIYVGYLFTLQVL